ncbi:unnamed protein product, partial [Tetraodon nigroviridis]
DCRRFLNFFNSSHGDQRRVYSFPCLTAFLDSAQLFPPNDEQLEKFWIDFNTSSECVSFFVDNPQVQSAQVQAERLTLRQPGFSESPVSLEGFLWGSIHLLREEVHRYSFQLKGGLGEETVLSIQLNNPIEHHDCSGQTVELAFDPEHQEQLEEAARRVFREVRGSPCRAQPEGKVQGSQLGVRVYSRKKPKGKGHLKSVPLELNLSAEKTEMLGGRSSPGGQVPPTRADAPLIRIKVLTCLFPVQELCGPSRKRASEDS